MNQVPYLAPSFRSGFLYGAADRDAPAAAAPPHSGGQASAIFDRLIALFDAAAVPCLGAAALALTGLPGTDAGLTRAIMTLLFGTLLAVNLFRLLGVYRAREGQSPAKSILRLAAGWLAASFAILVFDVLAQGPGGRVTEWLPVWIVTTVAVLPAVHGLAQFWLHRRLAVGAFRRHVAVVGDPELAARMADVFQDGGDGEIALVGVFTDLAEPALHRHPYRHAMNGGVGELLARLRQERVDSVVVALPEEAVDRLQALRLALAEVPVDVRLCPGLAALELRRQGVSFYAGVPTLNLADRPLGGWRVLAKAVEDRLIGLAITILISPILVAVAIAIRLDSPGPILFRQKRTGYNNRVFDVLKFRTMRDDQSDGAGNRLTERDDPRVTRVGAFLRRWSLDELPQFLNVLRGEMSIVGPRPHALSANAGGRLYRDLVPFYDARHKVKPGITGLAQIRGWRGPTTTSRQIRKRVESDLDYIEHWSLWLDLKIILITAFKGFRSENAF